MTTTYTLDVFFNKLSDNGQNLTAERIISLTNQFYSETDFAEADVKSAIQASFTTEYIKLSDIKSSITSYASASDISDFFSKNKFTEDQAVSFLNTFMDNYNFTKDTLTDLLGEDYTQDVFKNFIINNLVTGSIN